MADKEPRQPTHRAYSVIRRPKGTGAAVEAPFSGVLPRRVGRETRAATQRLWWPRT